VLEDKNWFGGISKSNFFGFNIPFAIYFTTSWRYSFNFRG
jgi:hypothetical protein